MKSLLFTSVFLLILPAQALAHGEDAPGPHGGEIRMPGAMHTELVREGRKSVRVYLLDVQFENPMVIGSSVRLTHRSNGVDTTIPCAAVKEFFRCEAPTRIDLLEGELVVDVIRNGVRGGTVTYSTRR